MVSPSLTTIEHRRAVPSVTRRSIIMNVDTFTPEQDALGRGIRRGVFVIGYYDSIKNRLYFVPFTAMRFPEGDHFSFQFR